VAAKKPPSTRERKRAAAKKPATNGDSLRIPDALGAQGRVQVMVNKLREIQGREADVVMTQQLNGDPGDAECAGAGGLTYDEAIKKFKEMQERLLAANPELRQQVEGYLMALSAQMGAPEA
jgi:hypothetical protein